uniref:Piezo domain-containing protein n=1 Tax=Acrobeloides nanus TaxID=290746 RepID=A0A914C2T7_9BILA
MLSYRQNLWNIGWRVLEIHIGKLIAALMIYISINEVSLLNIPLIVCVVVLLSKINLMQQICNFLSLFTSIVIIWKMTIHIEFIHIEEAFCLHANTTIFSVGWIDFKKTDDIFEYTKVWQRLMYFLCIGASESLCLEYLWDDWDEKYLWDDWDESLVEWLCLPTLKLPSNSFKLYGDFVQLLFICCQLHVFKIEAKRGNDYPGGSNETISTVNINRIQFVINSIECFKVKARGMMFVKSNVPDFITESNRTIRALILVIPEILAVCEIPQKETGIFYDTICFIFLLIQRRIFGSEYFKHVIFKLCSQKFFASRGAEILTQITKQDKEEADEKEKEMLWKVMTKMRRIKERNNLDNRSREYYDNSPSKEQLEDITPSMGTYATTPTTPTSILHHRPNSLRLPNVPSSPEIEISETKISMSPENPEALEKQISENEISEELTSNNEKLKQKLSTISGPMEKLDSIEEYENIKTPVLRTKSEQILSKKGLKPSFSFEKDEDDDDDCEAYLARLKSKNASRRNSLADEGGVKGLGPLQLINFALQKGAIKEAVEESNELEAIHDQLEKEMEETFGMKNYQIIREAILNEKTRQKVRADFDEEDFDEASGDPIENLRSFSRMSIRRQSRKQEKKSNYDDEDDRSLLKTDDPIENLRSFSRMSIRRQSRKQEKKSNYDEDDRSSLKTDDPIENLRSFSRMSIRRQSRNFSRMSIRSAEHSIKKSKNLDKTIEEKCKHDSMDDKTQQPSKIKKILMKLVELKSYCKEFTKNFGLFMFLLGRGILESVISYLMRLSRDYRYMAYIIEEEKKVHKELISGQVNSKLSQEECKKQEEIIRERLKSTVKAPNIKMISDESFYKLHQRIEEEHLKEENLKNDQSEEISSYEDPLPERKKSIKFSESVKIVIQLPEESPEIIENQSDDAEKSINDTERDSMQKKPKQENIFVRLVLAVYYVFMSRSERLCYALITLNHISSASFLSMPLPLMMLLWGTLSVPQPSRKFWIAVITYTEVKENKPFHL